MSKHVMDLDEGYTIFTINDKDYKVDAYDALEKWDEIVDEESDNVQEQTVRYKLLKWGRTILLDQEVDITAKFCQTMLNILTEDLNDAKKDEAGLSEQG